MLMPASFVFFQSFYICSIYPLSPLTFSPSWYFTAFNAFSLWLWIKSEYMLYWVVRISHAIWEGLLESISTLKMFLILYMINASVTLSCWTYLSRFGERLLMGVADSGVSVFPGIATLFSQQFMRPWVFPLFFYFYFYLVEHVPWYLMI